MHAAAKNRDREKSSKLSFMAFGSSEAISETAQYMRNISGASPGHSEKREVGKEG